MSKNYIPKVIKIKFMYTLPQLKLSTFGKNVTTGKFKAIVSEFEADKVWKSGFKIRGIYY